MKLQFRLPERFRTPIIADRTVDLMALAYWLCYTGWGMAATIAGLPTVSQAAGQDYRLAWGFAIGVAALVAFTAVFTTFLHGQSVITRIRNKVIELVSVSLLTGLIAVYPILLIIAAIGGDESRIAVIFTGISFMIFPTWRIRHLFFRIRRLREAVTGAD